MTAYTIITPALVAVGAKPFATTIQALRDNPIAIAECDATAPVNAAGWHPYDKVFNNDANTGRIWSFAVNGAQATITTPDLLDGWDYGFMFDSVLRNSVAGNLEINFFRETTGAYSGITDTGVALSASNPATGFFEIANLRLARLTHFCVGSLQVAAVTNATTVGVTAVGGGVRHATAQKITRLQFTAATNTFQGTGAAIYMFKRRNLAS